MNTNIQIFRNGRFGEIRILKNESGEFHFVAKDVAERLGYNTDGGMGKILSHIPSEWKFSTPNPNGGADITILSEQGLYFFLARSDKPTALPFQKWIAGEVLPSIRKQGGYMTAKSDDTPEMIMARALQIAQITIDNHKQRVQMLEGENESLNNEVKQLVPKAEYTDKVLQSTSTYTMTQIAKELGMSAVSLEKKLHEDGVMFRQSGQWILYAKYQDKGYTKSRTHHYSCNDGSTGTNTITVWTEKGRAFIHKLFEKEAFYENWGA
ncbi:MAG: phage antirepressor KilAC domain-containing protein [Bacteroidales bacterium]|jgi:prophage antirepressor-like protein|nr:phage antirepressor KilAC domain-containing protein [Bacteroidales bacterium]